RSETPKPRAPPRRRPAAPRPHAPTHEDLVTEQEGDRREKSHHDVWVAQRLGEQPRAESVQQPRQEAREVSVDKAAGGQESTPGRKRDAAGDQQVVGDKRTGEGRDRPEED